MFRVASVVAALAVTALSSPGLAEEYQEPTPIYAYGSGWLSGDGEGFYHLGTIANHYVDDYEWDWFAFSLPTGTFTSATMNIWNNASDPAYQQSTGQFTLRFAPTFTYEGFGNGPVASTAAVSDIAAHTGQYYSLDLNSPYDLDVLNAGNGRTIIFGGRISRNGGSAFGGTNGEPRAFLALTGDFVISAPEPATWGLMLLGFGAMGYALRRRAKVRTSVSLA